MIRFLTASTALTAVFTLPATAQSVFELDEIIFTATAQPVTLDRVGASVTVVDAQDIQANGDVELADVLNRLPGISFSETGPAGSVSQLRIRGADARYISVYVDGILVNDPTHPSQNFDNFGGITAGSIERVEILRGSQSALYGGTAVGGVVSVTTLPGDDAPLGLSQTAEVQGGSYATISGNYTLSYRTEDSQLSFGLSSVRSDGFSAADERNGNSEDDGYDQTRLTFGYERDIDGALTLGVNGFYETGSVEFDEFGAAPIDGTPDEEADRETYGLRLYGSYDIGAWTSDFAITGYDITRDSDANGVTSNFEGERYGFEYVGGYVWSEELQLSFGVDLRDETGTYSNAAGGSNSVTTYGAFTEALFSPTANLDVTATLRYDDHSEFGSEITGRFAVAYRPTDALTLRGAVGTGYRPPSLDELFGAYPAFAFFGNSDLTPETSVSYEVGADYQFANGAVLSATAFRIEIDELITFEFGVPTSTLVNVSGTSERSGIELSGLLPVSDRLSFTGAYTLTDATDASGNRLTNVPRHDLALGVDATLSDRLSLTANAQFIGDRETGQFDPESYEDYTVVNTTFTYDMTDDMEAFFRVENLFDEQYQTTSGYGTSDRAVYVGLRASF